MEGERTTLGLVAWYDTIANADASLVKVMKDAGGQFAHANALENHRILSVDDQHD